MRIIAIDFGAKRIGIAISDELLLASHGMETIEHTDNASDIERIVKIVAEHDVSEVVVGLPLNMNGTHSQKTEEVLAFAKELSNALRIPVRTWDERLTTMQAERTLLEADVSRLKRRRLADKLAAQLILQSYLDFRRR
ncbi:MAG: Holliday junction resolvase RuvX [Candidatus Omnitrophica bacterium]|nr:Holliday junction resolvase RuvX [Candidatus Omnitrophota bacterium]MCM8790819.1 Holliday junction resolvase RuvX [Candidatus Omnitrophota bacterium]